MLLGWKLKIDIVERKKMGMFFREFFADRQFFPILSKKNCWGIKPQQITFR